MSRRKYCPDCLETYKEDGYDKEYLELQPTDCCGVMMCEICGWFE